jgi:hypothetical protein
MGHRLELPADQLDDLVAVERVQIREPGEALFLVGAGGDIPISWC